MPHVASPRPSESASTRGARQDPGGTHAETGRHSPMFLEINGVGREILDTFEGTQQIQLLIVAHRVLGRRMTS